ncbi:LuxR C-terminal-related transcriptional regulator [Parafrankia discariae]|uniref:LuxR C-terminal-related transcriptional regulator n=1 Tax=Parafrankia discariae TaxID=365528 RepID=UPI00037700AE|nr:response regulator transcription factor [Parafrankia discariae]
MELSEVVSVLLADGDYLARQGLRELIDATPDLHLLADVADGRRLMAETRRLRPDVVVLDFALPEAGGLDAIRWITADPLLAGTRIILLAAHSRGANEILGSLVAGASAFLFKDEVRHGRLEAAIRDVAGGTGAVLSPRVGELLVARLRQSFVALPEPVAAKVALLTPRERQVLDLLVVPGRSNADIGRILGVSPATVKTHMQSLLGKLNVPTRVQAARIAALVADLDLRPDIAS